MAKKAAAKKTTKGKKKADSSAAKGSPTISKELSEALETSRAIPYTMQSQFQVKNVIEHPKFGLGLVTRSLDDKIEVNFTDGMRSLVHNRK